MIESVRLVKEQEFTDFLETDIFEVLVKETLGKGVFAEERIVVVFPAHTVQLGEQHIVALRQLDGGSFYEFTSKYSIFPMYLLEMIKNIIYN